MVFDVTSCTVVIVRSIPLKIYRPPPEPLIVRDIIAGLWNTYTSSHRWKPVRRRTDRVVVVRRFDEKNFSFYGVTDSRAGNDNVYIILVGHALVFAHVNTFKIIVIADGVRAFVVYVIVFVSFAVEIIYRPQSSIPKKTHLYTYDTVVCVRCREEWW